MLSLINTLPPALRAIYDAFQGKPDSASNAAAWYAQWGVTLREAREHIPALHVESGGESVYLGELSPGCQACKNGTWDCVFMTMHCNLNCAFCCNPHAIPADYTGSAFGATPADILVRHARTTITGVSFSGGEPFTDPPKLFDWIRQFKTHDPHKYYWVYTNGLLVTEAYIERLAQIGVDELRFNLAAVGYTHPRVLRHVAAAARSLPIVTVEIPAIPTDAEAVFAALETWCAHGVRFLNLHQLMYEPGTNAESLPGARETFITPDGHRTFFDPASQQLVLDIMRYVSEHKLPLAVNSCSLQSKLRQVRGRRRSLVPLVRETYEKCLEIKQSSDISPANLVLESYGAFKNDAVHFFHPDDLGEMRARYPDHTFVRLVRTAPLSVHDPGQWIEFEVQDELR